MDMTTSLSVDGDAATAQTVDADLPTQGLLDATGATARPASSRTGGARRSTGPLEAGQAFGSRYHIIRALGVGGMGAVYQAWDDELGVAVAMKVIRPDVMADPIAAADVERRFKRELLLARQVTHNNVVRIYDLGEIDGIKYITMSFVDGADLATRLRREGTLPVAAVMPIARQIVSGLVAAHKAGVVHRDLKPANIMIDSSGDALIMDFGIARSSGGPKAESEAAKHVPAELRRSAAVADVTKYGSIVGTVEYMAPEQARGQHVDHRADIYAFGLILYDMLAGRRRSAGTKSAIEELQGRMAAPPPPVKSIVPEIPDALDRLISRCLEPDPANRYATTEELAAELDRLDDNAIPIPLPRRLTPRLIGASVALVALLVTSTWWLTRTPPPLKQHAPVSILLADFENQTGEPVIDGTLEPAFATALEGASFINEYRSGPAHSIAAKMRPGAKRMDEELARLVAMREGVNVVIAGRVTRGPNGYRVGIRAVEPGTGKEIAAREIEVANRDAMLAAVGRLTAPIRKALGDSTNESAQLVAATTFTAASLDAAHEYSLGQQLKEKDPQNAVAHYRNALNFDPNLGMAYLGMAAASVNLKKTDDAARYYKAALGLLDHMSEREKQRTLAAYYASFVHDYDQAIEAYKRLVTLYPADAIAYNNLSIAYVFKLDFANAVTAIRRAIELSPKNVRFHLNYVIYSVYAGDFATVITEAKRMIQDDPKYPYVHLPLALSTLARGDARGARDIYAQLETLSPSTAKIGEADLEMYLGRYKAAVAVLEDGIAADARGNNTGELALKYVAKAEAHLALGQKAQALQAARKAAEASSDESVEFPAARALIAAGDEAAAERIAGALDKTLQTQSRSYAQLILAEIALKRGRYAEAIDGARAAQKQHDSWISHFLLGRAYLEAQHFAEALSNFDICLKRQGEAADLMFADSATLRYLPPVYFYAAQAQMGVGVKSAATENFKKFIALRADADSPDPLAATAQRALSQ
jgi:serine/threonine protein kinase/tetratricopeptide (TPR) repeat protein